MGHTAPYSQPVEIGLGPLWLTDTQSKILKKIKKIKNPPLSYVEEG